MQQELILRDRFILE